MVEVESQVEHTDLMVSLTGLRRDVEIHTRFIPGDGVTIRFWNYSDGVARRGHLPRELQEEAIERTLEVCDVD
ncbi:MAG: hypothetical protein COA69_09630 [Robiginitomaculum sp.]|nr:MAG: hypothetical protein COA69_09630 [Robiginitomaculum sp.]